MDVESKLPICICKYPLILTDKRDGEEHDFISFPLSILDSNEITIPDMEVVKDVEGFDGKKEIYMKVKWNEMGENAKRYNVREHIVYAGCPEHQLICDTKSIYEVYHPIDEWNDYHVLDIRD